MKYKLDFTGKSMEAPDLVIMSAFNKDEQYTVSHWKDKEMKQFFEDHKQAESFAGKTDETFLMHTESGSSILVYGLGDKKDVKAEQLRKAISKAATIANGLKAKKITIDLDGFNTIRGVDKTVEALVESLGMTLYKFDKYLSNKTPFNIAEITFFSTETKAKAKAQKAMEKAVNIVESIHYCRDLVNEAPNVLRSTEYARLVKEDVKKNLKGVKVKVLGRKELEKEGMNLFLSVNDGSGFEPQLVHLTYEPKKVTKNTKHIALVGKGLVFDTGGYSLKPGGSMMNMKFDMAGSATVYGAFRAAVLNNANVKVSCFLGITDNAVSSFATMPDSIVKARNGKTVEILNTDAEGRLVLADVLDYACDQKPDAIFDAATLTGACLVALGQEVAGLMTNNTKLVSEVKKSSTNVDEYVWELPIIPEFREDMKSPIADLKNIGTPMRAGTATAAAFLENFIKDDIPWVHFDIAGIADGQKHLPYCPAKGASGLIIRTMHDFIFNGKF